MNPPQDDPYRILGVPAGASENEIRAAYRKLARENHPDLHPGDKGAAERMAVINAAYASLRSGPRPAGLGQHSAYYEIIECERCERSDVTLRVALFARVYGLILAVRRSGEPMVLCKRCRGIEALKANAVSLLTGWWALFIGPFYVVVEGMRNAFGGHQVPELNAALLHALAASRRATGDASGAQDAAREAAKQGTGRWKSGSGLSLGWTAVLAGVPALAVAAVVVGVAFAVVTADSTEADQLAWNNRVVTTLNDMTFVYNQLPFGFSEPECSGSIDSRLADLSRRVRDAVSDPPPGRTAQDLRRVALRTADVFVPFANGICRALRTSDADLWNRLVERAPAVNQAFVELDAAYEAFREEAG